MDLVEPVAAAYRGSKNIDFEDLVQAGREGLVKAVRSNRFMGKSEFKTFLISAITTEIQYFIRDWKPTDTAGSAADMQRKFGEDKLYEWQKLYYVPLALWETLYATPEDLMSGYEQIAKFQRSFQNAMLGLEPRERDIICARYLRETQPTLNAVAREFKLSYSALVRLIERTLCKLADNIEAQEKRSVA